ncbi:VWA domain-containing protein [uncultured Tateyamaria sp.]|uniref:VWA domain-containing protein n=1 Tax=uncultured Tateyamaria sp. TaxID=455651 RepID=UPI002617726E|nr:VWA domain-containing protein [uncultured Tateyamaria sp.]
MTPRALDPFFAFPQALRAAGYPASPDRTETFITAVGLLGPKGMTDIRRAAHAVYGPGPDRSEMFDAVFDRIFLSRSIAAPAMGDPEDLPQSYDAGAMEEMLMPEDEEPSGGDATAAERLFQRAVTAGDEGAALRAFRRALPRNLPRRRSRRRAPGKGRLADARRTFREMLRRDGEIIRLPTRRRLLRQRRVLMLLDVSGSMKEGTDGALRLAHALQQGGERVECFTLGTRLTRVTRALRHRNADQALMLASGLVADWDGGTRLGEALQVFLSVPRFAAHARGALVIIVSDGLERGGPEALVSAMERMDALAWSTLWLSPLVADPTYRPETGAMQAILPLLDHLGDGSTPPAIASEILQFSKGARR